jgi:catechol 2,3-dioxygenase-like lactoylglutathione lyase family enzyme
VHPAWCNPHVIEGVDFVFLWTQDFERAARFYVDTLGLERSADYRGHGGEFETDGFTISMLQADKVGMTFQAATTPIAFRVDDVGKRRAELEEQGVEFAGDIVDSGVCHQAFFTDPDGNRLILHHRYAPR